MEDRDRVRIGQRGERKKERSRGTRRVQWGDCRRGVGKERSTEREQGAWEEWEGERVWAYLSLA